jgi:integrase
MNSFLTKDKDTRTYEEKISTELKQTQRNKLYSVRLFHEFVKEEYSGKTVQDIVDELKRIKQIEDHQIYESALYGMLQDWNNWNQKQGRGNYTIRVLFSNLRKYLLHLGIKTNEQDIKEYLNFGKRTREERYPLSNEEYVKIVNGFARNPRLQALFLALGSSGMRIGEAVNLKRKDLDTTKEKIKINITTNTKTRSARSTYISKETQKILEPILKNLNVFLTQAYLLQNLFVLSSTYVQNC